MTDRVSEAVVKGVSMSLAIRFGQILVSLILVRLLSAEVYGQFGLLTSIIAFVYVFSMERFMEHSFHQSDGEVDLDRQFTFGLILHVGLFVAINIAATVVAYLPDYAAIELYLRVVSIGLLLNVPRIFHSVILQREMNWQRIRLLHLGSFILSSLVALYLAFAGYGLWSLVLHSILVPVPYAIDALSRLRQVRLKSLRGGYLPTLRFGFLRNTTEAATSGQLLLESTVLVAAVGFSTFGLFGRAIAIAQLLCNSVVQPMMAILYPALSQMNKDSHDIAKVCGLIIRTSIWVGLPFCLLLIHFPDAIIEIIFGKTWLPATEFVPLAAVVVMLVLQRQTVGVIATSQLSPKWTLAAEVSTLCGLGIALIAMSDLNNYLLLLVFANVLVVSTFLIFLIQKSLLNQADIFRALITLIVVGGVTELQVGYVENIVTGYSALAVQLIVIPLTTVAVVRMFDHEALAEIVDYLPGAKLFKKLLWLS